MTEAQKASDEFEQISEQVVTCLFQEIDAKIIRTRSKKDGGYDIVVECQNGSLMNRAFFECKLRGQNLNLRDIAANTIIAFNHGAASFVAITNHGFTPQLGDELEEFARHTVLNIKIIIGKELKHLLETYHISFSEDFQKCLLEKGTNRQNDERNDFQALRIRYDQDILEQLFYQNLTFAPQDSFLAKIFRDIPEKIYCHVNRGELVLLSGYTGLGKHRIAKSALSYTKKRIIEIDACFHQTRDALILEILSKIWGISEPALFAQMKKEDVNEIASWIGSTPNADEIRNDLTALLNEKYADKRMSERQNILFSYYIANLLTLHSNSIRYCLLIDNLQFCHKEIYDFLVYLIKRISQKKVGCVILYHEVEYKFQTSEDIRPLLQRIPTYQPLHLSPLKPKTAECYLRHVRPELSLYAARMIVKQVGVRLYNLDYVLNYIFQIKNLSPHDDSKIAAAISSLTPNDIPGLIALILPHYQEKFPALFETFFLFDGQVPLSVCTFLKVQGTDLDRMISAGIFKNEQGMLIAHDELIRVWIRKAYTIHSPSIYLRASTLLPFFDHENAYTTERISLYHVLGQFERALELIDGDLKIQTRNRQYTVLQRELTLAIALAEKTDNIKLKLQYLSQLLNLYVITKKIATDEVMTYLEDFRLSLMQVIHPTYLDYAFAYFSLKREFKLGHYSSTYQPIQDGEKLYQACVAGKAIDNTDDWLGKLCGCYILIIKLTQGNSPALRAFRKVIKQLPESFELQREYLSHLGCMALFSQPNQAFLHYQAILDLFQTRIPDSADLPFHEYGDLAMSLLLAKRLDEASKYCKEAIQISQSNGLIDEEGRNLNILGCIQLCQENLRTAEQSFREATAIMRHVGCRNYAWRSELNYIQLRIFNGENSLSLENELCQLYSEFKMLLKEKIKILACLEEKEFRQTREYHALLVFGFCLTRMNQQEDPAGQIPFDFELTSHKNIYQQDLANYLNKKIDFQESPYFHGQFIFSVG